MMKTMVRTVLVLVVLVSRLPMLIDIFASAAV